MISTVGDALIADIIADPADDGLRLVLADWLEEHGGPEWNGRADYIRDEVAGRYVVPAKLYHWPDLPHLLAGRDEVALRILGWHCRWSRGFVSLVSCRLEDWLAHGPAVAKAHPLQRVELTDREPSDGHPVGQEDRERWGSGWGWWPVSDAEPTQEADEIPEPLWDLLPEPAGRNSFWKAYPSTQAAIDALSDACVRWARSQ